MIAWSEAQARLLQSPLDEHLFVEGLAGAGKTTAAVGRMLASLEAGIDGESLLVLAPQRTLLLPYQQALRSASLPPGGLPTLLTIGGLARRMVDLFWPLAAPAAGFAHPERLPTFLTLETAQYFMAFLARPLLEQGLFDSVVIDRNRLYAQLLDDLNKAAVCGFSYESIGERLKSAWRGEPGQVRVYDDVQTCVSLFRRYCLEHNLLDFSLQMEVFLKHLWPEPRLRQYLVSKHRRLIVDNLEEDTPATFDLLREWLPYFDSVVLVYDWDAGYRAFLGADPQAAYALKSLCHRDIVFDRSLVSSPAVQGLAEHLDAAIAPTRAAPPASPQSWLPALEVEHQRFFPQMLDWVAARIASLVHEGGIPAGEIVVLAPFLSDVLRFSIFERLKAWGVPARSLRPSRSLRDEPAARCLATLSALAFPQWEICPSRYEVAYALVQAIEGLDLVRGQLLTEIVYRPRQGRPQLTSFDQIQPRMQERLTYRLGERFERLRLWLAEAQDSQPEYDHFLSRLFGELLSQPRYGFHGSLDAGRVAASLVESVRKFRQVAGDGLQEAGLPLGREYLRMLQEGVIAAQYLGNWEMPSAEAVLVAPAYTFLLANQPVSYQFWLEVGGSGWAERLYQPLTHPVVLSRRWSPGRPWTEADEVQFNQEALLRLVTGLLRRCREKVFLGVSELGEQGYEPRGPLLRAFQRLLRQATEAG